MADDLDFWLVVVETNFWKFTDSGKGWMGSCRCEVWEIVEKFFVMKYCSDWNAEKLVISKSSPARNMRLSDLTFMHHGPAAAAAQSSNFLQSQTLLPRVRVLKSEKPTSLRKRPIFAENSILIFVKILSHHTFVYNPFEVIINKQIYIPWVYIVLLWKKKIYFFGIFLFPIWFKSKKKI